MNDIAKQEIQNLVIDILKDVVFPVLESMSIKISRIERTIEHNLVTKQYFANFENKLDRTLTRLEAKIDNMNNRLSNMECKLDQVATTQEEDSSRIKRLENIVMPTI